MPLTQMRSRRRAHSRVHACCDCQRHRPTWRHLAVAAFFSHDCPLTSPSLPPPLFLLLARPPALSRQTHAPLTMRSCERMHNCTHNSRVLVFAWLPLELAAVDTTYDCYSFDAANSELEAKTRRETMFAVWVVTCMRGISLRRRRRLLPSSHLHILGSRHRPAYLGKPQLNAFELRMLQTTAAGENASASRRFNPLAGDVASDVATAAQQECGPAHLAFGSWSDALSALRRLRIAGRSLESAMCFSSNPLSLDMGD
mmetsp:Transcript_36664/g.77276  ORF Transcript_36664/g.77276 Transcript_36664/m.77276 type:complete len:256 (-) Transcript_36664:66-833(-)